jgi:hypothetical protein
MVDTDAKRIASFKRGLGPKMMKHEGTNTCARFNDFISDCLKQEKNNNAYTASRDENETEIFRIDRFRFLYYEPFFNMKNCQFQLVSQPFSSIFCTL